MHSTFKEWAEFAKRGEEKFVWVISMKSTVASVIGFIIGQRVAEVLGLRGWMLFSLSMVLMVGCGVLVVQVRGVMLVHRLFLVLLAHGRMCFGRQSSFPARRYGLLQPAISQSYTPSLFAVMVRSLFVQQLLNTARSNSCLRCVCSSAATSSAVTAILRR